MRAEQAELLLAQTQRSHEEQLRAARLEESTRIAREIHDVLAHTLAGLTIQLEATSALVEQGAERDVVLRASRRAHELAREGLRETRRAVGALRGEAGAGAGGDRGARRRLSLERRRAGELTIDGDPARLAGPAGQAVVRVAQEALTNVAQARPRRRGGGHGPRRRASGDDSSCVVDDGPPGAAAPADRARRQRRRLRPARACASARSCSAGRSTPAPATAAGGSSCGSAADGAGRPAEDARERPVRVLVVDDQALVREGLMTLLEARPRSSRSPPPPTAWRRSSSPRATGPTSC